MMEEEKKDIEVKADETAESVSENATDAAGEVNDNNGPAKNEDSAFVKKLKGGVLTSWFIGYILTILGGMFGTVVLQVPLNMLGFLTDDHPVLVTGIFYLAFFGIWVAILVFIRGFKKESPYLRKIIGRPSIKAVIGWVIGLIFVGGLNMICIFGAMKNGDIYLDFNRIEILPLLFLFFCVFVQSGAEELTCRGFIYRRIEKTYNPIVAMIFNSLLFALMHIMNPGVTVLSLLNVFLSGILFSLIIYYTDSMACAMAGHAGWNFSQSIIFGLPNSGQVFPYSVFKLDATTARDSFFYNVGFGVEGTALAVIMLAIGCVAIIVLGQLKVLKRPEKIKPLI